jgi:hypothetical protein
LKLNKSYGTQVAFKVSCGGALLTVPGTHITNWDYYGEHEGRVRNIRTPGLYVVTLANDYITGRVSVDERQYFTERRVHNGVLAKDCLRTTISSKAMDEVCQTWMEFQAKMKRRDPIIIR